MASNKRSARARRRAEFDAGLDGAALGELFAREHAREEELDAAHDAAVRRKACESKNRYDSRAEAMDAAAACAARGRGGLSVYRCPYCKGWHLTSHPRSR